MRGDRAFGGDAAGLLARGGETLLAKDHRGLFHVAVRLGERALDVRETGAGLLAELLDQSWIDRHFRTSILVME
jgi:hypothetical protein